jgi:DnaJ-class molecular chaperone
MPPDEPSVNDLPLNDFFSKHSLPDDFLERHFKALRYDMALTLREAMFGGTRQISVSRMTVCIVCQGQGDLKHGGRDRAPTVQLAVASALWKKNNKFRLPSP